MSITVELIGGARIVSTADGVLGAPIDITCSATVTVPTRKIVTIASAASDQAVAFDSVSAGKILVLVSDGRVTCKVNSSATAIPCDPVLVHTDTTSGGIVSLTLSNASGATRTVEIIIA